jgi:thiosulfate/3-mercaptopyruvate sulfurtransferase
MLIEPKELEARLLEANLRVLDARSRDEYLKGHIPGAIWVDVASWQAQGRRKDGFHDKAAWSEMVGGLGIDNAAKVVVYGSAPTDTARIWWTLKYLGVADVAILNGGWNAWTTEGRPTETAEPAVAPARFEPDFQADRLEEIDTLKEGVRTGAVQMVDARSAAEYTGQDVRGPRGGHIPSAAHLEWKELLTADGRFKSRDELRELFRQRGILPDETAVCY